jgi:hypothetical protein
MWPPMAIATSRNEYTFSDYHYTTKYGFVNYI